MKKWHARFSIQQKLITLLIFGFTGFLIYFAANFVISRHNQKLLTSLVEQHLPILEDTESLALDLNQVKTSIAQSAFSTGIEGMANLEAANKKVTAAFANLKRHESHHLPDLEAAEKRYTTAFKGANDLLQNVVAGLESLSTVQNKLQQFLTDLSGVESWATEMKAKRTAEFRASVDSANIGSRRAMWAGWFLVVGGFPFALFFFLIMRDITNSLRSVSSRLTEVAQNVLKISSDASTSSSRLASSSSQQSAAVTESVSSMEQMKSMLGHTVKHSANALRSSEESFREASDGKEVIDELRAAMHDIERAYEELEEVNQVVSLIRSKTNIINDIVFKTQLLSFNASIEAARAGQHGRGFSVVAAEVGKLAEMSGMAAQEIGKLLDHSTKKVAEIVQSTKGKVGSANQMSQKCATVFERITDRAGQVKTMVDAITGAASEQESGIQQVGRAMTEMKESAEQTDRMALVISGLSATLKGHSQSLASTVDKLESLVHGERTEGPVAIHQARSPEPKSPEGPQRRSA